MLQSFFPLPRTPPVPTRGGPLPLLDLDAGLARLGYGAFRPGQREAIETLLDVGRLLLVAPTGGGKSLIYQLPATLLPGTTVVISPLISLMQDQVAGPRGARRARPPFWPRPSTATRCAGAWPPSARGAYKLVYVAPERLALRRAFAALLRDLDCPLVAIDEAHCISEWGHDFRPEYLQIGELLAELPARAGAGLHRDGDARRARRDPANASACAPTRRRSCAASRAPTSRCGRARCGASANASAASTPPSRRRWARPATGGGAAIVYAPTRRATEEEAARLAARGLAQRRLPRGAARARSATRVQRAFAAGELEVVVGDQRLRHGDRSGRRARRHPPGAAGLDRGLLPGGRSRRTRRRATPSGLLLLSPGDMPLRRHLHRERRPDGRAPEPEVVRHKWNLFLELMRWAEGGSCRHDAILRYFGDEEETLAGCGRCDVCRRPRRRGARAGPGGRDRHGAQGALRRRPRPRPLRPRAPRRSCCAAADDPRLARSGLDRTPDLRQSLRERAEEWLMRLLRRCVTAGWVDFRGGDRPGRRAHRGGRRGHAGRAPRAPAAPARAGARRRRAAAPRRRQRRRGMPRRATSSTPSASALFEALRRTASRWPRREACRPTSSPATARCATSPRCARARSRRAPAAPTASAPPRCEGTAPGCSRWSPSARELLRCPT